MITSTQQETGRSGINWARADEERQKKHKRRERVREKGRDRRAEPAIIFTCILLLF